MPISEMAPNALLGAAFCKWKLCSGSNLSPNASWLRIAALAWFSPSPMIPIGPGGFGLPLAPWALLLGWWSPQLETNSKRLLLRGVG